MTKTEIARRIHVMNAWLDGKTIQVHNPVYVEEWRTIGEDEIPKFNFELNQYRVKPEKKVAYINLYNATITHEPHVFQHPTRVKADANADRDCVARVRVEYVEGQFDE